MPVHTIAKENNLSCDCFKFLWKHFNISEEVMEDNVTEEDGDDSLVETIFEVGLECVQIEEEEEAQCEKIDDEDEEVDDDAEGNGKRCGIKISHI